jgi:hypothetical protein
MKKLFEREKINGVNRISGKVILIALFIMLLSGFIPGVWSGPEEAHAAACTSAASGSWATAGTWNAPCNVAGGPTAADTVTITSGHAITVDAPAACTSLAFPSGAATSVTISGTNSLTVSGAITMARPGAGGTNTLSVGNGSLTAASIAINATTAGRTSILSINTGTVTVSGNLTSGGGDSILTFTGAGTLNAGGTFMSGTAGTFTAGTGTVNFNAAGAQAIAQFAYTFNNVTLSGSGAKTTTNATINGILSMEGTATTAGTSPTYGAAATLKYNRTTALTASLVEWPTTFTGTGGVIIAGTGAISLANNARVFSASVPLTINSGATLITNGFNLTFGGNFVNNGGTFTASNSNIDITNTATTQSIAGFTTLGNVSMTKTAGTATFIGNVNAAGLTINGVGGTLNLGAGLTHTFTGVVTLSAGTLNGGSSILNENATSATAWNGTGTNFVAGTGTVVFGGAAQTLATASTFNNLTFAASGVKTLTGVPTVNGVLSMEGTATVSAAPTYGAAATLKYNTATARTAGAEWITPFAAAGGVIVANTGTITMNAAKVFNASVPLTINNFAALATNNFQLTLGGNFVNNGTFTAGSSNIVIANTAATQSIAGFTTTGTVSMTKTAGTATFTNNVNAGAVTLNGSGGTLNLGAGLTHTVTGNWTNTAGTLNSNTSTVTFNGTGAQTISGANTWYGLAVTGTTARTVSFQSGVTQTVTNDLTFTGSPGQLLTLAPVTAGSAWRLNAPATQSVSYVSVSYSDANSGETVNACDGTNTDDGNNINWIFVCDGAAVLTVTPLTWNVVGLDSNNVDVGPNHFPVGARVCNTGTASASNVTATFVWNSSNTYIDIRPGTNSILSVTSLHTGACTDFYFEVEVTRDEDAYDTTRQYQIDVTADGGATTGSTPPSRELYVEHLISQSRNHVTDMQLSTDGSSYDSVAPGGTMTLVVGNTYWIKLVGSTATNGYEQIETFINFPNTIFQVLSVDTTYTAETSATMTPPYDQVYGDACVWENDLNSPNYLSCISTGKAGGDITVTYKVMILSVPSSPLTNPEALSSLVYDFSGSSFHYNADHGVSTRYVFVLDPTTVTIAKNFSPDPTNINGVSALTFTITNPNDATITDVNFTDTFPTSPGNMVVASTPGATTSNCGTPTFAPTAGAASISFSNGTLAPNSSCTVKVNVTAPVIGAYNNTSGNLFIDTIDTGNYAEDTLTVNDEPAPPACTPGLQLAYWDFESSLTPNFISSRVSTATASHDGTLISTVPDTQNGQVGWSLTSNASPGAQWPETASAPPGYPLGGAAPYFQFLIDTSNFTGVQITFDVDIEGNWASAANNHIYVWSNADGGAFDTPTPRLDFTPVTVKSWYTNNTATASTTGSSTTGFRINEIGAKGTGTMPRVVLDNVSITGCGVPQPPTLTKAFSPNPIAVNATSTLTFTLTNENNVALTNTAFTDDLPAGLEVANPPGESNTCGATFAPTAGATTLTVTGGTIPARVGTTNGSCTVTVSIKATTAGPHNNVSGYISTTETGTNTGPTGSASASLTAVLPPSIAKQFAPNPILADGTSTLTFTITNLNLNDSLSDVAFIDTFPTTPDAMTVASPLTTTNTCGGSLLDNLGGALAAGDAGIQLTGGTVTGGSSCTVTVDVTAPAIGTYDNTSGNVSHIINAATVNGNFATASLIINPPNPAIAILKQVSTTATGPWTSFLAISAGEDVYYMFTIENIGNVPLDPVSVSDPTLSGTSVDPATCSWTNPLPVASPTQDPTETCVMGPVTAVSGSNANTATAHGTYSGTVYDSTPSTATYATTGLTIVKSVLEQVYIEVGDPLNYSYVVTNSGYASLFGPVTVADDKVSVDCPAVSTAGDGDDYLDPGESMICGTQLSGPVAVTNGSAAVTGTNTAFSTELIPGDSVYIDSVHYTVLSITDNYNLTLSTPYAGTTDSGLVIFTTATYTVTSADVTAGSVTNIASASTTAYGPIPTVTSPTDSETVGYNPTLVLLSSFMAYEDNGKVVVRWETSSELKTLGFLLLRLDENTGEYKRVNSVLLPAMMRPPQGGIYSLIDRGAYPGGTYTYKLVEIERNGAKLIYGPFTVFAGSPDDPHADALKDGSAGKEHVVSNSLETLVKSSEKTTVMKHETDKVTTYVIKSVTNNPVLSLPSDFTRQLREQSGTDKARLQSKELWYAAKVASKSLSVKGSRVKLSIVDSGIYYISANDISSLMGISLGKVTSLIRRGQLSLSTQGKQVAYLPAAKYAGLYFYATEIDSIYTRENVYWIDIGPGTLMTTVNGKAPSSTGSGSFVDTIHFEKDSFMDTYAVSDPDADYWFWADLYSPPLLPDLPDVREFTLHVDGVADTGTASIKANLYGAVPVEFTPHNHAQVFINDVLINDCLLPGTDPDSGIWSGMEPYPFEATFSQSCLLEGDNIITVQNVLDSGVDESYFYVDSFDLTYTRLYEASNNELLFKGDGNTLVTVGGFTSSDIMVFDITDPLLPKLQNNVAVKTKSGTVSLVPAASSTPYYAVSGGGIKTAGLEAVPAPTLSLNNNAADYIIIAPEEFVSTAQTLADYRKGQGLKAKVVKLKDVMNEFNFGISSPEAIKSFLSYAYSNWTKKPRYVLLAGDGSIDYKDNMGYGSNLVPTKIVSTPYGPFASDTYLADVNGDHIPEMAIGRLPAITGEELQNMINKIKIYEGNTTPTCQLILLADNLDDDLDFTADSEAIASLFSSDYCLKEIYLDRMSVISARTDLFEAINSGAFYFNYIGHGGLINFASENILKLSDLSLLTNSLKLPVLTAMTCLVGNFEGAGYTTLSEGLLLKSDGGVAAVWSPTGFSDNSLAADLDHAFYQAILSGDNQTLGETVNQALSEYKFNDFPTYMMDIYNLLGDPVLRLK